MDKTRIGIVGNGNISGIYLTNLTRTLKTTQVTAVADLIPERVRKASKEYGVPNIVTLEEMVLRDDVDIVLSLTQPPDHALVLLTALEHGKHAYTEKPLSASLEDGRRIVALAKEKGLYVGGAPDTFMGAGIQTAVAAIDTGLIGRPVAATAFMTNHGHESWHPDPAFYYHRGGGPLFDMGPYYLTALFAMLGPVKRVTGMAAISFAQREITSEPKRGEIIDVEVATHVSGVLQMANGAIVNLVTSFDVWAAKLPFIEIYGEKGSLSVPDPNTFGGEVKVKLAGDKDWRALPNRHCYAENSRGIGVADMGLAIREGREQRASGARGLHVLETMHGILFASEQGRAVEIASEYTRPAPVPEGYEGY